MISAVMFSTASAPSRPPLQRRCDCGRPPAPPPPMPCSGGVAGEAHLLCCLPSSPALSPSLLPLTFPLKRWCSCNPSPHSSALVLPYSGGATTVHLVLRCLLSSAEEAMRMHPTSSSIGSHPPLQRYLRFQSLIEKIPW
jgi:hypothetical protein